MTSGGSRSTLRRIQHLLVSPRLAFWLLLAWLLLYAVWVLPFTLAGQTEDTVGAIALQWLPLQAIYALLGLTTVLCMANRIARDWRRSTAMRVPPSAAEPPSDATLSPFDLPEAAARLSRARFRVVAEQDALHAVRGRYRPLWGSAFHLSLLLVAGALALSAATASSGGVELIEGQSAEEFFAATPERAETAAFRPLLRSFTLQSVRPRFFGQYLLFERLDATASYRGRTRDFSLARPLWLDAVSYISIQDFNYAPHVVVTSADGGVVDDVVTSLELFPPGSEDTLDIPSAKISLAMQVFPEHATRGGKDVSLSYNMDDPRIRLTVFEKVGGVPRQRVLARRTVAPGETVALPDGTGVTISEIRTVGTFRVVRAPTLWLVLATGVLLVVGLAGRLLFPRLDVLVWRVPGGVGYDARLDGHGRLAGRRAIARLLSTEGEDAR